MSKVSFKTTDGQDVEIETDLVESIHFGIRTDTLRIQMKYPMPSYTVAHGVNLGTWLTQFLLPGFSS